MAQFLTVSSLTSPSANRNALCAGKKHRPINTQVATLHHLMTKISTPKAFDHPNELALEKPVGEQVQTINLLRFCPDDSPHNLQMSCTPPERPRQSGCLPLGYPMDTC